ncbi:MAG: aconitase X catalytic domain-containing protein [Rhodospirillales bacterium]|nr:aconitase X catalytic domain-containing protein [Rhodospirillales bacterium]
MLHLSETEKRVLVDESQPALAMAMRILVATAEILGASRLIAVASAHIDGCLYLGDSGVFFAEKLVQLGGRVAIPATLNVGALDLIHPHLVQAGTHHRSMAKRQMQAYLDLGCQASWTCAPYQTGHRPGLGENVAWGESNAVVFANSVLGARTNRYGDLLDICLALSGRAPYTGLHRPENRHANLVIDLSGLPGALKSSESFFPVLGSWLGRHAGASVPALTGFEAPVAEDHLKALGAGAASTGAVGMFHIVGQTPEAATLADALGGNPCAETLKPTLQDFRRERDRLSQQTGSQLDCVALGSPHFSYAETRALLTTLAGRSSRVPFYVCTNRFVLHKLEQEGLLEALARAGIELVIDTCVAVAPILRGKGGVMMTNSAKFAHYGPGNTGYQSVFGSLADCVDSAVSGKITRNPGLWQDQ